ncbi:hypothetical protein EDC94DRAFT_5234 [Helicostylum pulchrum]|nr:hypothetical protein EDC94DRAFT_5234 [Helicostylum pulchrum]
MHTERPWLFTKEAIKHYSKADYQIKFWGYIYLLRLFLLYLFRLLIKYFIIYKVVIQFHHLVKR